MRRHNQLQTGWQLTVGRYTRLSNRFSRKIENHMAAGVSTRLWDVADLVDLLIDAEKKAA